jgi:hypothetical protein
MSGGFGSDHCLAPARSVDAPVFISVQRRRSANLAASVRDPLLRLPRSRGQPDPHPGAALSGPAIAAMTCTGGTVRSPRTETAKAAPPKRWRHDEHGHGGASQWLKGNL